jgi:AcrR family transcriptional regulator
MEQKGKCVSPFSNEARNAYVVEHITEALIKKLKHKPLDDISVSELCDEAGVGRTSFYRNFESREDVIKKRIRSLFFGWARDWEATGRESAAEMYGSMFRHFKDNMSFYLLLRERGLMRLFLEVYMERYGPSAEDVNMWAYTKSFIAYGTYGWIEEWIARGMTESADAMAELLSSHGMK